MFDILNHRDWSPGLKKSKELGSKIMQVGKELAGKLKIQKIILQVSREPLHELAH